jgi:hypothetical protein
MKRQQTFSCFSLLLSLAFGASVWVFFGYFYRYHLIYQEQYQLFQFTSAYMAEVTHRPGGMAEYMARFLTQFYCFPRQGAFIIACLLTLMQRQLLSIARQMGGHRPVWLPLTFVPSLFYGVLLCNEHYMLTGVVALSLLLTAFQVGLSIRPVSFRLVYRLLMLPMLYALTGGVAVVFALLCLVSEWGRGEVVGRRQMLFGAACVALAVLPPLLAASVFVQYPLAKLWTGANYYRFQTIFPFPLLLLWLSVPLVLLLLKRLPAEIKNTRRRAVYTGLQLAALALLAFYGVSGTADWKKEEVMKYDYYVRSCRWDDLIRQADKKAPGSPLSVAFLNLALCKEGVMPERMFHYFQNGPEGLLPSFARDFTMPMMAGEIYFHLGFVNTAQRLAFEAMEAIPDYQKSSRAVRRLAETNLVNGHYEVAGKYLRLLQKTLFHRKWANETLACLAAESCVEANPLWADLRKYGTKTDFLFSEQEKDMMLGVLLQQNLANRAAYEYLMAYCLLTKNMQHFYRYYPLGKNIGYGETPASYQEALVYIWGLTHNTMENIPFPVSDAVKARMMEYRNIYVNYPNAEQLLANKFSGTYWYYLHYRK